jgi:hypothetical protein
MKRVFGFSLGLVLTVAAQAATPIDVQIEQFLGLISAPKKVSTESVQQKLIELGRDGGSFATMVQQTGAKGEEGCVRGQSCRTAYVLEVSNTDSQYQCEVEVYMNRSAIGVVTIVGSVTDFNSNQFPITMDSKRAALLQVTTRKFLNISSVFDFTVKMARSDASQILQQSLSFRPVSGLEKYKFDEGLQKVLNAAGGSLAPLQQLIDLCNPPQHAATD